MADPFGINLGMFGAGYDPKTGRVTGVPQAQSEVQRVNSLIQGAITPNFSGPGEMAKGTPGTLNTPTNRTTGGVGGSGGGGPVVNRAAVNATQQAIDSLATELSTGYSNVDDNWKSILSQYDKEAAKNEADYNDETVTNATNLQKNKQNSLVAASQGRRGLRATLASLGALSGDGGKLADRAVTTSANQDIGEAADTYSGNAVNLDKAIGNFRDEDKDRRVQAETAARNQKTALEGSVASKRQQMLQKMAEIFSAGGDTGSANRYLGEAGGLNNEIASKSRVISTPLEAKVAAFTPGELENYLAGAGDMTVDVAEGGAGPRTASTILAGSRRKKGEEASIAMA